ncbi:MAG: hypothetical protein MZU95_07515 [Desulfomicrobium escambiense]|nr:hypothetical protein [Desulfomicrobium escambiense]
MPPTGRPRTARWSCRSASGSTTRCRSRRHGWARCSTTPPLRPRADRRSGPEPAGAAGCGSGSGNGRSRRARGLRGAGPRGRAGRRGDATAPGAGAGPLGRTAAERRGRRLDRPRGADPAAAAAARRRRHRVRRAAAAAVDPRGRFVPSADAAELRAVVSTPARATRPRPGAGRPRRPRRC